MPWGGHTRFFCKACGRQREPDERFSARGRCADCGDRIPIEQVNQMRARSGPHFRYWRERMAASVGGVLLDERRQDGG